MKLIYVTKKLPHLRKIVCATFGNLCNERKATKHELLNLSTELPQSTKGAHLG